MHLDPNDQRVILQKNNSRWHTDSSYRYLPSVFSILYGQETLPPEVEGGQTQFSNMLAAYDDLPEDKKNLLQPLHQVHSYNDIRRLEPFKKIWLWLHKSNKIFQGPYYKNSKTQYLQYMCEMEKM